MRRSDAKYIRPSGPHDGSSYRTSQFRTDSVQAVSPLDSVGYTLAVGSAGSTTPWPSGCIVMIRRSDVPPVLMSRTNTIRSSPSDLSGSAENAPDVDSAERTPSDTTTRTLTVAPPTSWGVGIVSVLAVTPLASGRQLAPSSSEMSTLAVRGSPLGSVEVQSIVSG